MSAELSPSPFRLSVPSDAKIELLHWAVNGQVWMVIRPRTSAEHAFTHPPKELELFAVLPDDVQLIVHSERDGEPYESHLSLGALRDWCSHQKDGPA